MRFAGNINILRTRALNPDHLCFSVLSRFLPVLFLCPKLKYLVKLCWLHLPLPLEEELSGGRGKVGFSTFLSGVEGEDATPTTSAEGEGHTLVDEALL